MHFLSHPAPSILAVPFKGKKKNKKIKKLSYGHGFKEIDWEGHRQGKKWKFRAGCGRYITGETVVKNTAKKNSVS